MKLTANERKAVRDWGIPFPSRLESREGRRGVLQEIAEAELTGHGVTADLAALRRAIRKGQIAEARGEELE